MIVMESDLVVVCDALSETRTVKVDVPAFAVVPLINPPVEMTKLVGSDPDIKDHEYGRTPPVAARLAE